MAEREKLDIREVSRKLDARATFRIQVSLEKVILSYENQNGVQVSFKSEKLIEDGW